MEGNLDDIKKETKPYLQLDIKTWNGVSDGIFNYKEENQCKNKRDETDENGFYGRNQNNIIVKRKSQISFDNDETILFRIRKSLKDEDKYEIINPISKQMEKNKINIDKLNNAAWYVIRPDSSETNYCENENEEYILNENDILKFGHKKYEVIKIHINNTNNNNNKDNQIYNISQINKDKGSIFIINIEPYQYIISHDDDNNDNNSDNSTKESDENRKCRKCSGVESTQDNPKLRICSCKECIHFNCLKEKIRTQIKIHQNSDSNVKTYVCPKFNCEVCLAPYPLRFRIKEFNKIYDLIDYNDDPKLDYIVLESLEYIIEDKNYKIIYVILIKDNIGFGRNFFNDIIDTDKSDSREHAILKYNKEKGNITIINNSDTFWTLVLIKGNITVKEKKISFKVANNYITACMIEKNIGENVRMKCENNNISTNSSTCKTMI